MKEYAVVRALTVGKVVISTVWTPQVLSDRLEGLFPALSPGRGCC